MISARDLTARLASLLRDERNALAGFLVLLADFDGRKMWLELGHASLFSFLHRELGLSRGAAHYRKTASDLVRRFPEVVEHLREGRLCITSVVELTRVLTPENRDEVLPRFFHLSKRAAADVAAEIRPNENAPRREVVTTVRAAAAPRATEPAPLLSAPQAVVQLEGRPHANSAPPPAAMIDNLRVLCRVTTSTRRGSGSATTGWIASGGPHRPARPRRRPRSPSRTRGTPPALFGPGPPRRPA